MNDLVWYVGYGSNLAAERFGCYISGGLPDGSSVAAPGARDRSPARADVPVELAGSVYFGWRSASWGGGVAFYDPEPAPPGSPRAVGRAWLVTGQQFADVAAQEMHRPPGADVDLGELLARGRLEVGPGRYETLLVLGRLDEVPLVTISAPVHGPEPDGHAHPPSPAYLRVIARGLAETWGWDTRQSARYLAGLRGVGRWQVDELAAVLGEGRDVG